MEVAETMGAVDYVEDFTPAPTENAVPVPVSVPSSVSKTTLVDHTPPLRKCHTPYQKRLVSMALSNRRPVHHHRESKSEWHGHIMVGLVINLR